VAANRKFKRADYQKDAHYAGVAKAVSEILATSNVVAPVEVLIRLQRLKKQAYEDWRFGRIPYLERVCTGNLSKLNRILRILDAHSRAIGLAPSSTVYRQWGRGGKRIALRFTKSGDPNLEAAYSRHYVARNEPAGRHAAAATELEEGASIEDSVGKPDDGI
jgi:hypothetical protein